MSETSHLTNASGVFAVLKVSVTASRQLMIHVGGSATPDWRYSVCGTPSLNAKEPASVLIILHFHGDSPGHDSPKRYGSC